MAERVVTDPDGRTWHVHRRWLPRRARWLGVGFARARSRRPTGPGIDLPDWLRDVPVVDDFPAVLVIVGVVAALVVAWLFVFPALVFLLDLLVVLAIAAAGVATRVLFRRPWIVEATSEGPDRLGRGWPVVGWRASGDALDVVAAAIAAGREPILPRRAGEPAPPV